ncbi:MAG: bacillithiol biosynthesis deacetylase BshB1 [Saprospiraceae bacterium]
MVENINKIDVLAIGIHPDDIELACSGTILKHIDAGYKVGLLDLSRGELGTRGNAIIRTQEAMLSAKLMNASFRHQLNLKDGFFENNEDSIIEIIKIIRASKPRIILANAIEDRHPDHARASKLIQDACFYSGLIKIQTSFGGIEQSAWRPQSIYHYIQDYHLKPELIVDISKFMEKKMELILSFSSQFFNPNSTEPESPISSKNFLEVVKAQARIYGRLIQVDYAEGFNITRPVGVEDLFTLL